MNQNQASMQLGLFPGSEVSVEPVSTRKHPFKGSKAANAPVPTIRQIPPAWSESKDFELLVGGEIVKVKFVSSWLNSGSFHHFEFFGKTISSTGYRSDFVYFEQAIKWETPLNYATEKANELYAELLKEQKRKWRKSKNQK